VYIKTENLSDSFEICLLLSFMSLCPQSDSETQTTKLRSLKLFRHQLVEFTLLIFNVTNVRFLRLFPDVSVFCYAIWCL